MGSCYSTDYSIENNRYKLKNSTSHEWSLNSKTNKNDLEEFIELDEYIEKLESTCPGARAFTCQALFERLLTHFQALVDNINYDNMNTFSIVESRDQLHSNIKKSANVFNIESTVFNIINKFNNISHNYSNMFSSKFYTNQMINHLLVNGMSFPPTENSLENLKCVLVNLALDLHINSDASFSAKHEEFFAQLSERVLCMINLKCYTDILRYTGERLKILNEHYEKLKQICTNYDNLFVTTTGGNYVSHMEKFLDDELLEARNIRDKLGGTLEQWRFSSIFLLASATTATQALQKWNEIIYIQNYKYKLEMALNARKDFQESLISLECAQLLLPQLDIKYVSKRQVSTVKHSCIYIITDISNSSRYDITTRIFNTYTTNINRIFPWFYRIFNETLKQDFHVANDIVHQLCEMLRNHRIYLFQSLNK